MEGLQAGVGHQRKGALYHQNLKSVLVPLPAPAPPAQLPKAPSRSTSRGSKTRTLETLVKRLVLNTNPSEGHRRHHLTDRYAYFADFGKNN